jgi:hypothetical protein
MSDAQRAALSAAVEQLAWTVVREMLELAPEAGPRPDLPDPDLRQMWLTALSSLLAIRDSAEQLASSAALSAAQRGADYPAIGDAAGMTRQGARRKWPGLAGLSDERQRKLAWWERRGSQFTDCVRAVIASDEGQPESTRVATLRDRLDKIEHASPLERVEAFDMMLIDAHAAAVGTPTPTEPGAARASGLLAALISDAYAATNSHSLLVNRDGAACSVEDCVAQPIVELWQPESDERAAPLCHKHSVKALGQPGIRIVAAYQPDVALTVFAAANGEA